MTVCVYQRAMIYFHWQMKYNTWIRENAFCLVRNYDHLKIYNVPVYSVIVTRITGSTVVQRPIWKRGKKCTKNTSYVILYIIRSCIHNIITIIIMRWCGCDHDAYGPNACTHALTSVYYGNCCATTATAGTAAALVPQTTLTRGRIIYPFSMVVSGPVRKGVTQIVDIVPGVYIILCAICVCVCVCVEAPSIVKCVVCTADRCRCWCAYNIYIV